MIKLLHRSIFLLIFFLLNHIANAQSESDLKKVENENSPSATSFGIKKQSTSSESVNASKENNKTVSNEKRHFKFHFYETNLDTAAYYKAAYYFYRFDNYRFYGSRRIIYFANKEASIELYSAKELVDKYGKRISPLTIKDEINFPKIEFVFFNDVLKEQLVK